MASLNEATHVIVQRALAAAVFPGSEAVAPMAGLLAWRAELKHLPVAGGGFGWNVRWAAGVRRLVMVCSVPCVRRQLIRSPRRR